jgi:hypothetical protein
VDCCTSRASGIVRPSVAYQTDPTGFRRAPKGKLPYIDDDGERIADSTFIRWLPAAGRLPDIGQINRAVGIDAVVHHNTWNRLSSEVGSLTDIPLYPRM